MMGALSGEGTTPRVPPSNHRFELFESLRAIAALSVLVHHTGGWSNVNLFTWYGAFTSKLHLGVTLFFLISGFLLYRPHAVQMLGAPAAPPTGDYALRRAFRILPAYWVALTVLNLWPGLRGVFTKDWWVYYGLLQSYRPEWSLRGIGVAWSLSVEIAFYVLLPLVAVVLSWAGRRLDLRDRVGTILYGVFLWHLPLLETLQTRFFSQLSPARAFVSLALLILPLPLGLGWLSWRWIELPALRVARSLGGRGTLAAAAVGELGSAPRRSA